MKTQVEMKRMLFDSEVRQQSKTEFFSATDLVRAGNEWRAKNGMTDFNLSGFLKNGKKTNEFIKELEIKYGKVVDITQGRNGGTWVHPLLFIDIALAIDPKLKIEVYEWLFDNLIRFRNDSGDSYKEMSMALWGRLGNKREFSKYITRVANYIRKSCGVKDWESATEEQLKLRDKIHNSIKTLAGVLTSPDQAVILGIKEHIKK